MCTHVYSYMFSTVHPREGSFVNYTNYMIIHILLVTSLTFVAGNFGNERFDSTKIVCALIVTTGLSLMCLELCMKKARLTHYLHVEIGRYTIRFAQKYKL